MSIPLKVRVTSNGKLIPFRIVLIYVLVGGLWILLSDRLLAAFVPDPAAITRLQTAKGWFYVLATAWMLYALIKRDLAAIQRSEDALRESEERLARIIETTPNAITIVDRDGRVTFANAAAEEILGLSRSKIAGRTYNDPAWRTTTVDGKPLSDEQMPFVQVMRTGKPMCCIELAVEHPDGTRVILSTNSAPLRDSTGAIVGVVSALTDITEQKMAYQRAHELEKNKRDFYRRTIMAATEGKLIIVEPDEIEKIAGPPIASWDIIQGEDLGTVRKAVDEIARSRGMDENRVFDFILAIGEATTNAFKHAGGGTASLHLIDGSLMFKVSDQGPGIEALTLPEVALVRGYTTADSLGMGYKAILSVANKIYLATGPGGTTVAIEMSLRPLKKPLAPAGLPNTWKV